MARLREGPLKVKAPTVSSFLAAELAEGDLRWGGRAGARMPLGDAFPAPLAKLHAQKTS